MADMFDFNVGGAGWHFTSHLVALAALIIACFAIAGYISFRDDSIPTKALDKDGDGDHSFSSDVDINANLNVTGLATLDGGYGSTSIQIPSDGPLKWNLPSYVDLTSTQALTAQAAGVVAANNTILPGSTHVNLTAGAANLRVYINNAGLPIGHSVGLTNGANAVEFSVYDSAGATPRVFSIGTDATFVTVTSASLTLGAANHLEAALTTAAGLYRCTKVAATDWIIYPMQLGANYTAAASTTN